MKEVLKINFMRGSNCLIIAMQYIWMVLFFGGLLVSSVTLAGEVRATGGDALSEDLFSPTHPVETPHAHKQWFFHLNGYTIHFVKPKNPDETFNDYLLGLGGSVVFPSDSKWKWGVSADLFIDSKEEFSGVFGPTFEYRLHERISIGAAGFIMYKESFNRDYGFPILPVPLPYLNVDLGRAHLRTFYIPPVRRDTDQQVSFQLRIPL